VESCDFDMQLTNFFSKNDQNFARKRGGIG
jgi:hypothetical protein